MYVYVSEHVSPLHRFAPEKGKAGPLLTHVTDIHPNSFDERISRDHIHGDILYEHVYILPMAYRRSLRTERRRFRSRFMLFLVMLHCSIVGGHFASPT